MTREEVNLLIRIQSDVAEVATAQRAFVGLKGSMQEIANMSRLGAVFSGVGMGLDSLASAANLALTANGALAEQIVRDSSRLGVSAGVYQVLGTAARQTGTDMGELYSAMRAGETILSRANDGNKDAADTLEKYHLSAARLLALSPEERLTAFANAIARIPDPTLRSAAAAELFGKSGAALLPLLTDLAAHGFGGLSAEVQHSAGLLSGDMVQSLNTARNAAQDAGDRFQKAFAPANLAILETRANLVGFAADHTASLGGLLVLLAAWKAAQILNARLAAVAAAGEGAAHREKLAALESETAALQKQIVATASLAAAQARLTAAQAAFGSNGIGSQKIYTSGGWQNIKSAEQSAGVFMASGLETVPAAAGRATGALAILSTGARSALASLTALFTNPIFLGALAVEGAVLAAESWDRALQNDITRIRELGAESHKAWEAIRQLRTEQERQAQLADTEKKLDDLRSKYQVKLRSGGSRTDWTRATPEDLQARAELQARLADLNTLGPGIITKNQLADLAAKELATAKATTAELLKQDERSRSTIEQESFRLANDRERLAILDTRLAQASVGLQMDVQAADLAGDATARAAAFNKFEAARLEIERQRVETTKSIADTQAKADKDEADALERRAKLEAEILSGNAKFMAQQARDRAQAATDALAHKIDDLKARDEADQRSPFLTTEEKSARRTAALQAELDLLKQIAQIRADERDAATDPTTREAADGKLTSVNDAMVGVSSGLAGEADSRSARDTFSGALNADFVSKLNEIPTLAQDAAGVVTSALGGAFSGIHSQLTQILGTTEMWTQRLGPIAGPIVGGIMASFAQLSTDLIAQMIYRALLAQTLGAQTKAVALGQASATAAALTLVNAGPATLATIASFGGAAAAAPFELAASIAAGRAASVLALAEGGMVTGPGGPRDDAVFARLSAGEHVMPAHRVAALGADFLESLRFGASPLDALALTATGAPGSTLAPAAAPAAAGGGRATIIYPNTRSEMLSALESSEGRATVLRHGRDGMMRAEF